jgi:hypothetical protein
MKRSRRPVVRNGELHIYWGIAEKGADPDIVYHNGDGTEKSDRRLLYNVLGCERQRLNIDAPLNSPRYKWVEYVPSLLDELAKRGYDLTTLRFYIRKKEVKE